MIQPHIGRLYRPHWLNNSMSYPVRKPNQMVIPRYIYIYTYIHTSSSKLSPISRFQILGSTIWLGLYNFLNHWEEGPFPITCGNPWTSDHSCAVLVSSRAAPKTLFDFDQVFTEETWDVTGVKGGMGPHVWTPNMDEQTICWDGMIPFYAVYFSDHYVKCYRYYSLWITADVMAI